MGAQVLSTLPAASTAECVGELLAIRLEVQMLLVFYQLINHLTPTMSMESVSLMEHLVTTSGPMLLVYLRDCIDISEITVHAATLVILIMHSLHHLLEIITTANQEIQVIHLFMGTFIPKIDSGMASSVKASVAAMGNLLHGSVWS